ncbi:MAG: hypothetical protein HYV97_10670 [Bdellovibrio sp.]|nr:hypothetical protein [Bdellovibrio sp.]
MKSVITNSVVKKLCHTCGPLLTIVAILQLSLWPIENAKAACTGADMDQARNECAAMADKGYMFSEQQCRCVNTEQKEGMRDSFLKCKDMPAGEARQKCIDDNANSSAGLTDTGAGGWSEALGDIQGGITGIATTMALFNFLGSKDTRPGCTSRMLFSATAIVAFAAEVYSYFFLEKKLHDLRKQYADYVNNVTSAGTGSGSTAGGAASTGGLEAQTEAALKSKSPYDAQILAFDYLKKEQETIADVASTKKITYIIAAVGFGAAMVMAIAEAVVPTMIKCTLTNSTPELITWSNFDGQNITLDPLEIYLYLKSMGETDGSGTLRDQMAAVTELQLLLAGHNRSLSLDTYHKLDLLEDDFHSMQVPQDQLVKIFQLIKSTLIAEAVANVLEGKANRDAFILQTEGDTGVEDKSLFISLVTGVGAAAVMAFSPKFRTWMSSSPGVAIMSGVSMGLNIALAAIAAAEEENAKKNAEIAQKIRDQFISSIAAYCPNGRENLSEPNCYCYMDDGKKNPNRTNSDTCKALWQKNDHNLFKDIKSVAIGTGNENPIGCLTINRQFDADCKCKKFIDSKSGKNACYNVPMGATSLGSMGAGLGLGSTISDLNSLANGNFNKGTVNQNELNQRAARTRNVGNQLLKKLNDDRAKNKLPLVDLSPKGVANFINNNAPKEILDGTAKSKLSPDTLSNQERPVSDALKDAIAKTGLNNKYEFVGGGGGKKVAEEKKGFNFELDNGGSNASGDARVMDGFMDKKFNFKDNDIVKNGDASIWQVISNRYTKSALPRLFATDAEMKAMNAESDNPPDQPAQ